MSNPSAFSTVSVASREGMDELIASRASMGLNWLREKARVNGAQETSCELSERPCKGCAVCTIPSNLQNRRSERLHSAPLFFNRKWTPLPHHHLCIAPRNDYNGGTCPNAPMTPAPALPHQRRAGAWRSPRASAGGDRHFEATLETAFGPPPVGPRLFHSPRTCTPH